MENSGGSRADKSADRQGRGGSGGNRKNIYWVIGGDVGAVVGESIKGDLQKLEKFWGDN